MTLEADPYVVIPDLTPTDDRVLEVARRHGTTVAATWAGWSTSSVLRLRQMIDGYDRGRGRPSRAEMAAMAPSLHCPCARCLQWRDAEAARDASRFAATQPRGIKADKEPGRRDALCRTAALAVFFPVGREGRSVAPGSPLYDDAKALCCACPVVSPCLRYALANRCEYGVYGGLNPAERTRLVRLLGDDQEVAA